MTKKSTPGRNGWTALYQRPGRKTGLANDNVTVWADEDGRGNISVSVYFKDSGRKIETRYAPDGEFIDAAQIRTPHMSAPVFTGPPAKAG